MASKFKNYFIAIFLIIIFNINASAQILINEIASTNNKLIQDEDMDYPDWIELYNSSNSQINLKDWSFVQDFSSNKWFFPNIILEPQSQLLVFASGKNRKVIDTAKTIHHWETILSDSDSWNYFIGSQEPPHNWNLQEFNISNWTSGNGGFGYGDDDDQTKVPTNTLSIYYQKEFVITDPTVLVDAFLSMDYDDGFVAYLNGVEIARANILGSPVPYNQPTITDHEAVLFSGGKPELFPIPSSTFSALIKTGVNRLSIQVNNVSESSSDLSGRTWLHVGVNNNKKYFNDNPQWFDVTIDTGRSTFLHTDFKISSNELISLFDNNNILVDSIRANAAFTHSRTRIPDGKEWCLSDSPSPNASNGDTCVQEYSAAPLLFPNPGNYKNRVVIKSNSAHVYYTTDGSDPNLLSKKFPDSLILDKTSIIKIRTIDSGKLASRIVAGIYFINQTSKLPILSITSAPRNLFIDGTNGLAVYDKARGFTQSDHTTCHLQYFDQSGNLKFQNNASFTPVGNYSLDFAQKSIQFIFDEDYGAIEEEVPNIFTADKAHIEKIHGFRIRNLDDDANSTRMRDLLSNRMGILTHSGAAACQHVAVYINGMYWGHYTARELLDKNFMHDNYGVDPKSVNLIKTSYSIKPDYYPEEGTSDSFFEMSDFLINSNLVDPSLYNQAKEKVDVLNWVDYYANEIYNNNQDWYPSQYFNNTRLAEASKPKLSWKYILWDMGMSQGNGTGLGDNLLYQCLESPIVPNRYTDMMKSLLRNPEFKNYFINRFADLLNEIWKPSNISKMIDENAEELAAEINPNSRKWGAVDSSSWRYNVSQLKEFHKYRPAIQREHIRQYFKLNKEINISLNVTPKNAGVIKISSIIPDSLPWSGIYFDGNPVQITAIANPGFEFSHWTGNNTLTDTLSQQLQLNVSNSSEFIANFVGSKQLANIELSEINYNSDSSTSSGDWMELHNLLNVDLDVSGYTVHDDVFTNRYTLPTNTVIPKNHYLVLASDLNKFRTRHPNVTNVIGSLNFDLNNQGESISIRDRSNNLIYTMRYADSLTWPCAADGFGRTMELKSEGINQNLPESWFDGCMGGSPGEAFKNCIHPQLISEINYKSSDNADAGDWIEIYNNQNFSIDLSQWQIQDSKGNTFLVNDNTILADSAYIVVAQNFTKFKNQFPNVNNLVGPFGFGFSGDGDVIRIFNKQGVLKYSVCYNDVAPFPKEADGGGYTLELKDYQGNVNDGNNWFKGCPEGSPGRIYNPDCNVSASAEAKKILFEIRPNPASDYCELISQNFTDQGKIYLYNVLNQKIEHIKWEKISDNKIRIHLGNVPSGCFIVQYRNKNNEQISKSLIVHHAE